MFTESKGFPSFLFWGLSSDKSAGGGGRGSFSNGLKVGGGGGGGGGGMSIAPF